MIQRVRDVSCPLLRIGIKQVFSFLKSLNCASSFFFGLLLPFGGALVAQLGALPSPMVSLIQDPLR